MTSVSLRRAISCASLAVLLITTGLALPAFARDTDGDGMPDGYERKYGLKVKVKDGRADRDRDGLSNITEFRKRTNPRKRDTDKDGLTDGREVRRTKTNPLKRDTDGDTFSDGLEVRRKTDPKNQFDPCPFTGLKARSRAGRRAVGVVIDNAPSARPQAGLEVADVVIEHLVEGGVTRFLAIYGCKKATNVGPVRSARFDTPRMLKTFTRTLALSGANAIVQRNLDDKNVVSFTELTAPDAFTRTTDPAPENLFVNTAAVRATPIRGRPFRFGTAQPGTATSMATLNYGSTEVNWVWSDKKWLRQEAGVPSMTTAGQPLQTTNVLIQVADVNNSRRLFDTAGNPSPNIRFVDGGAAYLLRNGRVITGTWAWVEGKPRFVTAAGKPFRLAYGRTWIEILPSQAGDVKGTVTFTP